MIYIDKSYSMKFAFAIGHMAIEHWETHYNDLLVSLDCKTAGFFSQNWIRGKQRTSLTRAKRLPPVLALRFQLLFKCSCVKCT